MLKNWTIITQAVKHGAEGVLVREKYLTSQNHPNHRLTDNLISIIGNKETSKRIALAGEEFRVNQHLYQKKGGRPLSSYAVEYCLTLPKGCRPTTKQWQEIVKDCCVTLAKLVNLSNTEVKQYQKQIRAVLHQQDQSIKQGTGDHVHLIIGKVVGARVLKELQQKKATKTLKQAFNAAVLKHIGISNSNYKPYKSNRGGRLENYKYHKQELDKILNVQKDISGLQNDTDKWLNSIERKTPHKTERLRRKIDKDLKNISHKTLSKHQKTQTDRIKSKLAH
ncbi:hypothetical protein [Vibrio diabolicus]|uniref:hypothetical protein n=1 Tax=Vibrio diabolicus TaxID=50719 RepID=UPI002160B0F6|nr:hypothetical protein [Vibrio diabolicus]MCS0314269.1 hypothetical protein [Vibrio diabolicus]